MIKKTTNKPEKVGNMSEDRAQFVKDMSSSLILTMVSVNGKMNPDYPKQAVDLANGLADSLEL